MPSKLSQFPLQGFVRRVSVGSNRHFDFVVHSLTKLDHHAAWWRSLLQNLMATDAGLKLGAWTVSLRHRNKFHFLQQNISVLIPILNLFILFTNYIIISHNRSWSLDFIQCVYLSSQIPIMKSGTWARVSRLQNAKTLHQAWAKQSMADLIAPAWKQSCGWGLENPHCRPLFKCIFDNSRKTSGQALLQF